MRRGHVGTIAKSANLVLCLNFAIVKWLSVMEGDIVSRRRQIIQGECVSICYSSSGCVA
jgi:hypothetical protein